MLESLKKEFLELLDKDLEFRYAVAGYLGLSEILKRLDGLAEEQVRLREEQTKIWKEAMKIWEEIKALREEQTKIWGEVTKIWEEIKALREGQAKIESRIDSLRSAMISGFGELSKFAGLTFEEFVRKFLTASLRRSGEIPEQAELRKSFVDGEEINLFLEEPLIVGEVTGYAESAEEIRKLLRKEDVVRAKYFKEPRKILVILTAKRDAVREMEKIASEKKVELIIGRVID